MKSERSYPIYKVNKKAEASLVGGHHVNTPIYYRYTSCIFVHFI